MYPYFCFFFLKQQQQQNGVKGLIMLEGKSQKNLPRKLPKFHNLLFFTAQVDIKR
jgi:hypothetical protein